MWARLELDRLVAAGDAKAVAAHALEFGLVSPETSMVAIGSEVTTAGGVRHTRSVPVSLPAGMRWQEVQRETTVDTERDEDQESRRDDRKTDDDSDKAKKPEPARHHAKAGADENKGEDEGEDNETASPAGAAAGTTEAAPESASVVDIFGPDSVEAMDMTGKVSAGRFARLAASLGGGLVLAHGDAVGMGALALRADYGRATRVGGEASLWLVDGLHAQGELGLYAGRLFERFEVDLGPELHLGDGIGPALELAVRYYAVHRLDIYLREDAGLLFDSGTHAAQSSTSAGLELSW
jgi:hypothetical protein